MFNNVQQMQLQNYNIFILIYISIVCEILHIQV